MFVYLFLFFGVISCGKKLGKNSSRPNILFIMSDDHAYQAFSAYDDRLIQTLNIIDLLNKVHYFQISLPRHLRNPFPPHKSLVKR